MLHATDSSGRRISILNDDNIPPVPMNRHTSPLAPQPCAPPHAAPGSRVPSAPATPELFRADSYDSHVAGEPVSPLTPLYEPVHPRYLPKAPDLRPAYDEYYTELPPIYVGTKRRRPSGVSDGRSVAYDDDYAPPSSASSNIVTTTAVSSGAERPQKRFPCRYRDTHGCEKTFTTSGHASRHSKIHTAEKAVRCTFEGCTKKFTRADNMKQHLETHTKDKTRSNGSRPSVASSRRRSSSSGKSLNRSKTTAPAAAVVTAASAPSPRLYAEPLLSPVAGGVWDMTELHHDLQTRPIAVRSASGLDALALVAGVAGRQNQPMPGDELIAMRN